MVDSMKYINLIFIKLALSIYRKLCCIPDTLEQMPYTV